MGRLRDGLMQLGLRTAWAVGPRIPRHVGRLVASRGAAPSIALGLATPADWRRNAGVVLGRCPTRAETTAAVASYLRYWLEMAALPGWDGEKLDRHVRIERLGELQDAVAGSGCVVALPHLGNWDLAGAFACRHGLPVTSVAERLPGEAFGQFLRYRESLGMRILGHRDPGLLSALTVDARAGRLVCLVADRDLGGRGLPVTWPTASGPQAITMPAGPALVARRSGAQLRALTTHYEDDAMVITLSDEIPVGPGTDGLVAATQRVADEFARQVAAHVVDWHVFQPFFGRAAVGRASAGRAGSHGADATVVDTGKTA